MELRLMQIIREAAALQGASRQTALPAKEPALKLAQLVTTVLQAASTVRQAAMCSQAMAGEPEEAAP
jgi:hypothetical protein